jgi:hypothetical protein
MPEGTNSTYDNDYMKAEDIIELYNYKIWNNRFAKIVSIEDIEKNIN